MRENKIENYLVKQVEKAGGLCWKWTGQIGVPDRVVQLPGGVVRFVEVKAPTGSLSEIQKHVHRQMDELGITVVVVWSKEDVDLLMGDLSNEKTVE